ncbi:ABC transporter permease [Paenibacillus sp. 32O-W]|nr:ABC transporter permease [Paenibacillus sp. 32O-W]
MIARALQCAIRASVAHERRHKAYLYANRFTVAGMGEDFSKNLGLNYRQVVNIGLILVAAVSSVVLLTIGTIPFLGLIIPNIVSIYRGDKLKNNLSHTALLGAVFVSWPISTVKFRR